MGSGAILVIQGTSIDSASTSEFIIPMGSTLGSIKELLFSSLGVPRSSWPGLGVMYRCGQMPCTHGRGFVEFFKSNLHALQDTDKLESDAPMRLVVDIALRPHPEFDPRMVQYLKLIVGFKVWIEVENMGLGSVPDNLATSFAEVLETLEAIVRSVLHDPSHSFTAPEHKLAKMFSKVPNGRNILHFLGGRTQGSRIVVERENFHLPFAHAIANYLHLFNVLFEGLENLSPNLQ